MDLIVQPSLTSAHRPIESSPVLQQPTTKKPPTYHPGTALFNHGKPPPTPSALWTALGGRDRKPRRLVEIPSRPYHRDSPSPLPLQRQSRHDQAENSTTSDLACSSRFPVSSPLQFYVAIIIVNVMITTIATTTPDTSHSTGGSNSDSPLWTPSTLTP